MLKIQYPEDRAELNGSYLRLFDISEMQEKLDAALSSTLFDDFRPIEIETLLIGSIEELADIIFSFSSIRSIPNSVIDELKKIFNYDDGGLNSGRTYQPDIARFFSENRMHIKLCSCYFCNIDYISSFSVLKEYRNVIEFLQYATRTELKVIEGVGDVSAGYIKNQRSVSGGIVDLEDLQFSRNDEAIKIQLRAWDVELRKSQFTLDHFISKAKHPLVALSLYNLIPSCYSCNSKFKGNQAVVEALEHTYLSATSDNFNFHEDVKFQVFTESDVLLPDRVDDFYVWLTPSINEDDYNKFIRIFKLNSRYEIHKQDALNLMKKNRSYRPDKLRQIAELLGVSVEQVTRDVFGDEVFVEDECELPKSKFKKDILARINY